MQPITPPTDLLTLESLPFDTQKKVALNLPYETISSLCTVSKKLKKSVMIFTFGKIILKSKSQLILMFPRGLVLGGIRIK